MILPVFDKLTEVTSSPHRVYRIAFGPFVAFMVAIAGSASQAATVTLYDGAGLPDSGPWLFYASFPTASIQVAAAPGVQLQTTTPVGAGFSNYVPIVNTFKNNTFPILDRATGFELSFSAQLNSESHDSGDRAGFSLILLGSDSKGIELGFWQDEIWAQQASPLFTHGSGAAIDTTQLRNYRLRILDDDYTLWNDSTTVLTGMVQDYTAFGGAPYTLPNYLFLGDNTTSAGADVLLGPVTLQSNLTAVPEPSCALFCMLSLALGWWHCPHGTETMDRIFHRRNVTADSGRAGR